MDALETAPYKNSLQVWMHLKLQNYKSASEYNFTLDVPEVAKILKGVSE